MNFRSVRVVRPLTMAQGTSGGHITSNRKKRATDSQTNKPGTVIQPLSSSVRFSLRVVLSNHLVMATVYGGENVQYGW